MFAYKLQLRSKIMMRVPLSSISMSSSEVSTSTAKTILITGAAGYLGGLLKQALYLQSQTVNRDVPRLILSDGVDLPGESGHHVIFVKADLTQLEEVEGLFTTPFGVPDAIYCLHGIMSRGAEDNFDLGIKVNFYSVRNLLEAARKYENDGLCIKFIFTSSLAVYGGPLPDIVTPSTVATPQGTYGVGKLMSELLVNEYSRRGYVDGRILRLPTVIIRPGAPSAAASSFISGIIREPLNGQASICPVGDSLSSPELDIPLWLTSASAVIRNLVLAKDIPSSKFMSHTRVVCLPGFTATVRAELQALLKVGGKKAVDLVKFQDDPKSLGFIVDEGGIDGVVYQYFDSL